jgi:colanic acid biosynthesis glycosyl transferase WcaI
VTAEHRVWMVSELYDRSESTGYFITRIAEGLASHFPTCVLTTDRPDQAGNPIPGREERNGVLVLRCRTPKISGGGTLARAANALVASAALFTAALRLMRKGDVVIVVTNPPALPFLIAIAARLRRSSCVLLIHDVYPDAMIAAGLLSKSSLVARSADLATKLLFRQVRTIVTIGRDMAKLVRTKSGRPDLDVRIITNWGDIHTIKPTARADNGILQRLGIGKTFVIQYSGNIGRTHGLEVLIEAASRVRSQLDIQFLVIGQGAKRRWLEQEIALRRLSNVKLLPSVPRENLADSLGACDVAIITFVSGMAGVSVPSRIYNILAAGRPIIGVTESGSELDQVIEEEEVGWVVNPGDVDRLVRVIEEAKGSPERLKAMGSRARLAAERSYSEERVVDQYRTLVAGLVNAGT